MSSAPSTSAPRPLQRVVYDSGGCRLILDFWPVAVAVLGGAGTRADYSGLLEAIDRHVIARREPYVIVTDSRAMHGPPPADVRREISEWMKKNATGHTSLGSVTIVGNALVRGALTALYWLFEPPNPQGVVGNWVEARDWAVRRFELAGRAVPPALASADREPY